MNNIRKEDFQVLAKSEPETTLKQHIDDCLNVLSRLKLCFQNIPLQNECEFWELLRFALIFHDTGKSHKEFQKLLYGHRNNWKSQRHELFSLNYIHQSNLPKEKKALLQYAVIGHHKSIEGIQGFVSHNYIVNEDENWISFNQGNGISAYDSECNLLLKNKTWKILREYGLDAESLSSIDINKVVKCISEQNVALSNDANCFVLYLLLVGFVKQCDHLASAGILKVNNMSDADFSFLYDYPLYKHQNQSSLSSGNSILSAPTGSGKTESALLWLKKQLETHGEGRVFYILPYTASINAMYERLNIKFGISQEGNSYVGMLHGKLAQYIEAKFESADNGAKCKELLLKDFRTLVTPLKIVTPFQLLRHLFGLKGFEKGMVEWCGGYLIFDEIHAYDSELFAQIIVFIEFCTRFMKVHCFVMTATLPSFMLEILGKALGTYNHIVADKTLYSVFNRHRVKVENGLLLDSLSLIQEDIDAGKKVIVVCNTIAQSQLVYQCLSCSGEKLLLHGSFNARDRFLIEQKLQKEDVQLLIGTQAIEVSLDIDYDTIYTEPAPLDALIQRFGRVNRKRQKGLSLCHVFNTADENDKRIYDSSIVERSLLVLENVEKSHEGILQESLYQQYIDYVYPSWSEKQQKEYDRIYKLLMNEIQTTLSPLHYDENKEDAFYRQFEGIKVLPEELKREYQDYLNELQFIKADSLLVSIRKGRWMYMQKDGSIYRQSFAYESDEKVVDKNVYIIKCHYDNEYGLRMDMPVENKLIVDDLIL
ncbi:MAG: CRISPR-associated helicase Cas3' [Bacteroidaceae bacterium]|nr:CRISPR-associated helicase Cas3' [Bacteroidaceae bacterium]